MNSRKSSLNNDYSVKVIDTFEDFLSLKDTWDDVLSVHGTHQPFLCHDWFRIWIQYFLNDAKLFIVVLYRGDVPNLIAPLLIKKEKYKGVAVVDKIEFIGNIHSTIKNFIYGVTENDSKVEALTYLFDFLKHSENKWDIIELDSIPEENSYYEILRSCSDSSKLRYRDCWCYNDWRLEGVDCSGTEYFNGRTKNCKKEIRRRTRRLEDEGVLDFDITTDSYDYNQYIQTYLDVRSSSWKHPENDAAFLDEFRRFAKSKSWLRFSKLSLNDKPISCHMRIIANNTAYLLESVYDLKYKDFSPTTILRSKLMIYLIDNEKVAVIDTIRGDEEYKKEWTPTKRERRGITIFNNTTKGYLFYLIMTKMLPMVKKLSGKAY